MSLGLIVLLIVVGTTIWVGFDPVPGSWVFQDEQGHEIRRQKATELDDWMRPRSKPWR